MPSNIQVNGTDTDNIFILRDEFGIGQYFPDGAPGTLWAFGSNSLGRLGLNDTVNRSSPVQVGTSTDWSKVSIGRNFSISIKYEGSLWSWGDNVNGQLGQSDLIARSSPVQIGTLINWFKIASGNRHTISIKTDGTLWSWGTNANAQLGLGDTTSKSSPTQVGALTNWKSVDCAEYNSLAIKTDNTLWSWGFNAFGQLGLNETVARSSPVQVGTLTNWKVVSGANRQTLAVKTDGTLWSWGINYQGQLGLGNILHKSSPTQIGTLTNWSTCSTGGGYDAPFSVAVKTDGTLWAWGSNYRGQLGLNEISNKSSPVQVGTLTNWKTVSIGDFPCVVVSKTDGTLWAWGINTQGQLGLNDVNSRSSPTQVGTVSTWSTVSSGGQFFSGQSILGHTLAIRS